MDEDYNLIRHMLKLKRFYSFKRDEIPCSCSCALYVLCRKCINEDATIKPEIQVQLNKSNEIEKNRINEILSLAIACKRLLPAYQVVNEIKTKYIVRDKRGKELYRSDSFIGMIGYEFLITIFVGIAIMLIGLIVSGIAHIFD